MTLDKGYLSASLNFMVGGKPEDLAVIQKYAAAHPGSKAESYVQKVSASTQGASKGM